MTQQTDLFEEIESAVVRFAGDSGDGMQTVGERFTGLHAFAGTILRPYPIFLRKFEPRQVLLPVFPDFNCSSGAEKFSLPGICPMLWWP